MNRVEAIKEVQSAPIGPDTEAVCALLRPCFRMTALTEAVDSAAMKGSRFGGRVLLPPGVEWPQWDAAGHFGPLIKDTEDEVNQIKAVLKRQGIHDPKRYARQEQWLARAREIVAGGSRRMNFLARIRLNELAGLQCGRRGD